jgi:hypothetical protein
MPSSEGFHTLLVKQNLPDPEFRAPLTILHDGFIVAFDIMIITCLALGVITSTTHYRSIVLFLLILFLRSFALVVRHHSIMRRVRTTTAISMATVVS